MTTFGSIASAAALGAGILLALPADIHAADASGYFRMADNKQEYSHVAALSRARAGDASMPEVHVFLTTHPVDAKAASQRFDIDSGITEQLREVKGGMTRLTVKGDGTVGSVWFWGSDPSDSFNTTGFDAITEITVGDERIKGRFAQPEPRDFFDKTYQFDLSFDSAITAADFAGKPLASGGGEPGAAWLAYVTAVAEGNLDYLREYLGDSAEWMMPSDDAESSNSYLESLRYDSPARATVTGGWLQDEQAILKVEGKDSDGNTVRGLVQMVQEEGRWSVAGKDLTTVWE